MLRSWTIFFNVRSRERDYTDATVLPFYFFTSRFSEGLRAGPERSREFLRSWNFAFRKKEKSKKRREEKKEDSLERLFIGRGPFYAFVWEFDDKKMHWISMILGFRKTKLINFIFDKFSNLIRQAFHELAFINLFTSVRKF